MTGALAALVAAPCTAPFMGAALGFALAQPWPAALAVVLTLGLGMALPFLLLALSPALARRLPRPGPWMEYLKQLLAFPMFATAAWLLWVLSVQAGPIGVGAALAGLVLLALGLRLLETSRTAQGRWRRIAQVTAGVSLTAALWLAIDLAPSASGETSGGGQDPAPPAGRSHPTSTAFSAERLEAARAAGRPIFVNMTAAWCITCLVNERVALSRPAVVEAFAARDLLYLKGDWTNRDTEITEYLAAFGRSGVPLYVYYPPASAPKVLPQVLTESIVLDALEH
jgi:thiol:disulfide interchange protein DsbD